MGKETTLKVSGMHCDGCERSIATSLKRIDGVADVSADYESGLVKVRLDRDVDAATLEGAVEDAGYDVIPDDGRHLPLA